MAIPLRRSPPVATAAPNQPVQELNPDDQKVPDDNETNIGGFTLQLPGDPASLTTYDLALAFMQQYLKGAAAADQEGYARWLSFQADPGGLRVENIKAGGVIRVRITPYWEYYHKHPEQFHCSVQDDLNALLTADLGDIPDRAASIYQVLHATPLGFSSPTALRQALEGLTPEQLAQLKAYYFQIYRLDLERDFRSMQLALDGGENVKAELLLRLLPKTSASPEADARREANLAGLGLGNDLGIDLGIMNFTDAGHMEQILLGLSEAGRAAFKREMGVSGSTIAVAWYKIIRKFGEDSVTVQVFRALLDGNRYRAYALRLNEAMNGWWGGRDTIVKYTKLVAPGDRELLLKAYQDVTGGRNLETDLKEKYADAYSDEALANLSSDDVKASAARVKQSKSLYASVFGVDTEAVEREVQGRPEVVAAYQTMYQNSDPEGVYQGLSEAQKARMRIAAQGGQVPEWMILRDAISGLGTDVEAIKRVFKGKSKAEIDRIVAEYKANTGSNLEQDLFDTALGFAEVDGRDALLLRQLLQGPPATNAERRARVKALYAYDRQGSLLGGPTMDGLEALGLDDNASRLDRETQGIDQLLDDQGNLRPGVKQEQFDLQVRRQEAASEGYVQSVDSAARSITTAVKVSAGVVMTVVTWGGLSPVLAAALSGLVTETVGVATTVALRGDALGRTHIATEAIKGALATALTAGFAERGTLTDCLDSLVARFGDRFARDVARRAIAVETAKGAVLGGSQQGLDEVFNSKNWRQGYAAYVAGVLRGAGQGATSGAAGGATKGWSETRLPQNRLGEALSTGAGEVTKQTVDVATKLSTRAMTDAEAAQLVFSAFVDILKGVAQFEATKHNKTRTGVAKAIWKLSQTTAAKLRSGSDQALGSVAPFVLKGLEEATGMNLSQLDPRLQTRLSEALKVTQAQILRQQREDSKAAADQQFRDLRRQARP